jgi:hypothetical protein
MIIRFPVSPEQEEVIADHLLLGGELGMLPDERAWIKAQASKRAPNRKIKSADLDIENAEWQVEVVDEFLYGL